MTRPNFQASTVLKYSPRKTRLIINEVRGMGLDKAMNFLRNLNKGQSKKVHDLLKSAASNIQLVEGDYQKYTVKTIVAEEAYKLMRVKPRARGSAFRIRRRYARVKVELAEA